jgi:hypothetical protein
MNRVARKSVNCVDPATVQLRYSNTRGGKTTFTYGIDKTRTV